MRDPNTPINAVGKALYGEYVGDTDEAGDDIHVMVGAEGYKLAEIAINTLKSAGWRPPVRTITTEDELAALPFDALLHWIDDAGLPHAMFATQLQPPNGMDGMWPMTVLHEGGDQ